MFGLQPLRHISTLPFYDLEAHVSDGKVTTGHRARSIVFGDIHPAKLRPWNAPAAFGLDIRTGKIVNRSNLLDSLKPEIVFFHDRSTTSRGTTTTSMTTPTPMSWRWGNESRSSTTGNRSWWMASSTAITGSVVPTVRRGRLRASLASAEKSRSATSTRRIMDAVYVAGTMELQHGYNKGPSSWCVSNIVQYQNDKRALVTMQNAKWRA